MKTIAIIDDDIYIGDMVEEVLRQEGYDILRAYSGTEAVMLLTQKRPDLILLDLMLPGMTGEKVLPLIKGIPVIVISAKIEVSNKVELLRAGAVDYITKPFHIDELLARIHVQFRKNNEKLDSILTVGGIKLNKISLEVTVNNEFVHLTKTEFAILKMLMQNPDQVLTKSMILDGISEETLDCMESSLKVHVSNLRKKLKDIIGKDYIEAVWGIGFRFNEKE